MLLSLVYSPFNSHSEGLLVYPSHFTCIQENFNLTQGDLNTSSLFTQSRGPKTLSPLFTHTQDLNIVFSTLYSHLGTSTQSISLPLFTIRDLNTKCAPHFFLFTLRATSKSKNPHSLVTQGI